MHAAQLLAYLRNLAANQAEFIGTTVGKLTYSCSIHGTAQSGTVTVTRQSRVSARWRGRPAA